MSEIDQILPDFPPGPLDRYRKQASFDWKSMARILEKEEVLKFKQEVWQIMENDSLFMREPNEDQLSLEESRNKTLERALKLKKILPDTGMDFRTGAEIYTILGYYDWSVAIRYAALGAFFQNAVRGMGTANHFKYIEAAEEHQLFGTVCITEIGHGTNVRGLQTRATFDKAKQKFILHSPSFEAAKCWAANLGKTANYAYVMAQLYTPDGVCHGLHGFVVPIRDSQLNILPGVIIGDMGAKGGLNGLDNGYMMFDNYEIGKDSLLDKNGSVTPDGTYISPFKDPSKKFGASLGNLSGARIGVVNLCSASLSSAITIAIRYSAIRKQFGSDDDREELPVIEYQLQQWRLFPHLAAAYLLKYFSSCIIDNAFEFRVSQMSGEGDEAMANWGMELHAMASSAKPLAGWLARDAIQECREACGGHGYLKSAGITGLRDDNDAFLTFEGENNVLTQQTSNYLLNLWNDPEREKKVSESKLRSITFLSKAEQRLKKKCRNLDSLRDGKVILDMYKWLVSYLLRSTSEKYQSLMASSNQDAFSTRNNTQVYFARTLSIAYIQHFVIETFYNKLCKKTEVPEEIRLVLQKLMVLYALWSLEKFHMSTLYEGGYFRGPQPSKRIREVILELCEELKGEAVALVDAIAPNDFVLNSVLGASDGQVYKRLEQAMSNYPRSFEKSEKWTEFARNLKAKL